MTAAVAPAVVMRATRGLSLVGATSALTRGLPLGIQPIVLEREGYCLLANAIPRQTCSDWLAVAEAGANYQAAVGDDACRSACAVPESLRAVVKATVEDVIHQLAGHCRGLKFAATPAAQEIKFRRCTAVAAPSNREQYRTDFSVDNDEPYVRLGVLIGLQPLTFMWIEPMSHVPRATRQRPRKRYLGAGDILIWSGNLRRADPAYDKTNHCITCFFAPETDEVPADPMHVEITTPAPSGADETPNDVPPGDDDTPDDAPPTDDAPADAAPADATDHAPPGDDATPNHAPPGADATPYETPADDAPADATPADDAPDPQQLYQEGVVHGKRKQWKDAVRCFEEAAGKGHANAQNELGQCYLYGRGVVKNTHQALRWLQTAATRDIPKAKYSLGVCYAKGWGVEVDEARAAKLFAEAADKDCAGAQYYMARFHQEGVTFVKDLEQAKAWYQRAADRGHQKARQALADLRRSDAAATMVADAALKVRRARVWHGRRAPITPVLSAARIAASL